MSDMVMTADDMYEAYGPDGPDQDDLAAWAEAVERVTGDGVCECPNMEDNYCPDCGYDAVQAAEQRIGA